MDYFDELLDALQATPAERTPRIFAAVHVVRSIPTGNTDRDDEELPPDSEADEGEGEDGDEVAEEVLVVEPVAGFEKDRGHEVQEGGVGHRKGA